MRKLRFVAVSLAYWLLAGLIAAGVANAQDWPTKSSRIVVGMPAAGSADVLARMIAQRLAEKFGQPFVVENRPGANANIGTDMVAKSAPDGYTLAFTTSGPLANNRYLYKSLPFDPVRDLVPIVLVAEIPLLLVVNPKVQAKNLPELVALARSHPGQLNAGSTGNGAINHLTLELFKSIAKVDLVHVPFKGSPTGELLAGNIQVLFEPITSSVKQVQAGGLRALAVTDRVRFAALPDVPTAIEQGYDIEASVYFALVGPAGMPQSIVNRLNQDVNQFLELAATRAKLTTLGASVIGGPPERVRSMMESESKKWKRIIESSGVRLD